MFSFSPFPLKSTETATSFQLFTELPAVLPVTARILFAAVIWGITLSPGNDKIKK